MIDATAWVVAEAWIANGLRLRWGPMTFDRNDGWIDVAGQRKRREGAEGDCG